MKVMRWLDVCTAPTADEYIAELERELASKTQVLRFIGLILQCRYCTLDGCDIEDYAVACGLFERQYVTESCGDKCRCAEYDDFPTNCYRPTEIGRQALSTVSQQEDK